MTVHKPSRFSWRCGISVRIFWPHSPASVVVTVAVDTPPLAIPLPDLGEASDSLDLGPTIKVYDSFEFLQTPAKQLVVKMSHIA